MTDRNLAVFLSEPGDNSSPRSNFYAPGARDLLPLDVAQKRWVERGIQDVFHRWGYHRIITSTLERLETLIAGGAVDRETVIQIPAAEGGMLGLRPELTASIARAAVTRMEDMYPQRLYYNANVFRRANLEHHGRQQEFYQAGIELLGVSGILADVEAILLMMDCLQSLAVPNYQIILGEAGLSRALLERFPIEFQTQIRRCLAHLDRVTLEQLPLAPAQQELALSLLDLRGKPELVLAKLARLELDADSQATIAHLQTVIELLTTSSKAPLPLILDLSLIQTFDYYTGIVFEAVSIHEDRTHILGKGGRYDRLLALYHPQGQNYPGIGFALNIEDLQQVLQTNASMPHHTPKPDWLVVAISPTAHSAALKYSNELRATPELVRVEIYLNDGAPAQIRQVAIDRGIAQIAWVSADGVKLERLGEIIA
ncbi:ATP phosphoribosyltransferase regulatory subunit [Chamaesiphon sp. VAR_48_metabat_135_sub]|uniref:ATP phosphoribosyltransferase regulatory subunit n=1 Tax=Chamaesiphon sp. VAR_48_metabat_135_sub TaxID=2964699 RepID=UPI00286AD381|nr:ATP phosphoribosyltransferase regulatory subunit [Chamaesiphon sp. VAR_48_metabat_135_sub]